MSLLSRLNTSLLSANAIAQYESIIDGSAKQKQASPSSLQEPAAVVSLSGNSEVSNLEKHISDYKAGKGNLSQSYYGVLSKQRSETSGLLARSNPEASSLYSAYATIGLEYGQNARFTSGMNQTARHSAELFRLAEELQAARRQDS